MEMEEFGPQVPYHRRVPWQTSWESIPIMLPSSLLEPLRHNNPPTSSEIYQVAQFRTSICEAAKVNQEKRQTLLQELERLDRIEAQLHKQTQVCDVITAPIRHLPDDIIYQIVTSESLLPKRYAYTDPHTHTPSTFAQVCRTWRSVIHSVPMLWDRVRFDCANWNYQPPDALFERIKLFDRLSHPLKLSVHLDETFYDFDPSEDALQTIPILFEPNVPHTIGESGVPCVLKWLFGSWSKTQHLPISLHLDIPLLIRLLHAVTETATKQHQPRGIDALYLYKWRGINWVDLDEDEWDIHRLLKALPDLRHLWISGFDAHHYKLFISDISKDLLVYNNLRFLYLNFYLYHHEWVQILKFWPNIEGAWVQVEAPLRSSIDTSPNSMIRHDHIKVLHATVVEPREVGYSPPIFPLFNLHFPSLEDLNLYFADFPSIESVQMDVQQAFPSLAKVSAHLTWTSRLSPQDLGSLLRSFSSPSVSITLAINTYSLFRMTLSSSSCSGASQDGNTTSKIALPKPFHKSELHATKRAL
ncbi:hypothetical protein CVT24_012581 [Panaeolus cyanescens]|uniref:Uncharacterized protein n=1 Tax=Panaeolus cyanescens TaxID=181874 RepID=A0A409YJX8_9AGAR|nr:hypothetical protein CVT24_012581 [Panaeolus cyanescens]